MREYIRNRLEAGQVKSKLYGEVQVNNKPITRLISNKGVINMVLENISEAVFGYDFSLENYLCILNSYYLDMKDEIVLKDLRTLGVKEELIQKAIKHPYTNIELSAMINFDIKFKDTSTLKNKEQIISAYEDYINNPFSDGYTANALQRKYGLPMEAMKKLYEENRREKYKNIITKEQAFDVIEDIVSTYNRKTQFGNCEPFPKNEINEIIDTYRENQNEITKMY